ncbi:MAG: hypothetical protein CVU09_07740 [Bacteroidetes bacterium HGW-Bacteroidetes-4]|jgi:hypothetical protein|nr:MAG: hypothetical protein CVU09_07740 [Bacteroidetes bacterium HGW-Bacteroidetes-4]
MNPQPIIKTFRLAGFNLHHLFFKKLTLADYETVADTLSAYLYANEASLIQVYMAGSEKDEKTWNKACKQTFGEINWPLTRMNLSAKQPESSFCITCISGQTVKTLVGGGFISKIIETPDSRLGIVGASYPPVNEGSPLTENLVKGLLFTGCDTSHLLKAWIPTRVPTSENSTLKHPETETLLPSVVLPFDPTYKGEINHSLWALKSHHPEISIQRSTKQNAYVTFYSTIINHWESKNLMLSGSFSAGENKREQALDALGEQLLQQGFDWKHVVRGIIYCPTSADEKDLKELFKTRKIPLPSWLFVPGPTTRPEPQFWFDADFVLEKK